MFNEESIAQFLRFRARHPARFMACDWHTIQHEMNKPAVLPGCMEACSLVYFITKQQNAQNNRRSFHSISFHGMQGDAFIEWDSISCNGRNNVLSAHLTRSFGYPDALIRCFSRRNRISKKSVWADPYFCCSVHAGGAHRPWAQRIGQKLKNGREKSGKIPAKGLLFSEKPLKSTDEATKTVKLTKAVQFFIHVV